MALPAVVKGEVLKYLYLIPPFEKKKQMEYLLILNSYN